MLNTCASWQGWLWLIIWWRGWGILVFITRIGFGVITIIGIVLVWGGISLLVCACGVLRTFEKMELLLSKCLGCCFFL